MAEIHAFMKLFISEFSIFLPERIMETMQILWASNTSAFSFFLSFLLLLFFFFLLSFYAFLYCSSNSFNKMVTRLNPHG